MVRASRESTIVILVGWTHYFIEFHHQNCDMAFATVLEYNNLPVAITTAHTCLNHCHHDAQHSHNTFVCLS